MTDPESPDTKNEQELNLFADQTRPDDIGDAAEPPADNDARADLGTDGETPPQTTPASVSDPDADIPVIAPPPSRRQQTAMRPGIVSPQRPGRAAQPAGTAAAPPPESGHKPLPHPIQQNQSLGQILTSIRNARGLSIQEVALATRIRTEYLQELESDELLKSLPTVYVSAYVRKLVDVYDLSREDSGILIEKMHGEIPQDPEELPDKLIESVNEGGMVNEGEKKRIRKITFIFFSAIALVIIAIILLVIHLCSSPSKPDNGADRGVRQAEEPLSRTVQIDESEFDSLIGPEMPTSSLLKMSKTPGVRDTP